MLLILDHELFSLHFPILQYLLVDLRHLLLLVDLRQVVLLKLQEDLLEFVGVREEELIFIVVIGHVDQTELHQLLESLLPLLVGNCGVNSAPFPVRALWIDLVLVSWALLGQERELHLDIVMNVVIVLEDNIVVEVRVGLMTHDPVSFQRHEILFLRLLSFQSKLLARKLQQELLEGFRVIEPILVLLDVALDLRYFLVKLLDVFFLASLLVLKLLLLLFFLFAERLVFPNVVLQVCLVVFELLRTVDERLMTPLLLFLQVPDLLVHRVVCKFSQEHLFLLIDELVHILGALLARELHSAPRDMHGFMDVILLFQVEILLLGIVFTWRDISVFYSSQRRCTRCRILVPYTQILGLFLRLLALLLLGLPRHEDLLVVWGAER